MSNSIKVMDLSSEVISTLEFDNEKTFMYQIAVAVHAEGTSVIMYQKGMPKATLKVLENAVGAHNGFAGTVIRTEESKLLPEYVKSSGFGTVDYKDTKYWELKGFHPSPEELIELSDLYELILDSRTRIMEVTKFTAKQMVWTIKKAVA